MNFASVTEPQVLVSRWNERSIFLPRECVEFGWNSVKSKNQRLQSVDTKDRMGFSTANAKNLKRTHPRATWVLRIGHGFYKIHNDVAYGAVVALKLQFPGSDYFAQFKLTHHTFAIYLTY
jgi:hypothetical protein